MSSAKPIVVVGSINMDLVARVPHVPAPGETLLGRDFVMLPGGKGANQAVALARLGAAVALIGRVGDDELGQKLLSGLRADRIDTSSVQITPEIASGIAMITVADDGENAITVASGANFRVTPDDVDAAETLLRSAALCVLQLELPLDTVERAVLLCREAGVPTLLDPAPAPTGALPRALYAVDILSPNETEAAAITGLSADAAPELVCRILHERGTPAAVLKLGARGAYFSTNDQQGAVPGFKVDAVDTTAAGDAFTGALAVALSEEKHLSDALRFANAAGALACTQRGAQPAMPDRAAVEKLLRSGSND